MHRSPSQAIQEVDPRSKHLKGGFFGGPNLAQGGEAVSKLIQYRLIMGSNVTAADLF